MEARELSRAERTQCPLDGIQPDARDGIEEVLPGIGQPALDDAAVIGPVSTLDQVVPLDPGDEPGHRRGAQAEHLGDPTHRLRAFPAEEVEQADLAEGQVCGGSRRDGPGDVAEDPQEIQRRRGQLVILVS